MNHQKNSILKSIYKQKQLEVKALYKGNDLLRLKELKNKNNKSFYQALQGDNLSLIAEVKKASPSKGIINPYFDPLLLSNQFQNQGASALSVLTDKLFFQGDPSFIPLINAHTSLPILRKDFIIDPIQVYESVQLGASAILLIQAILTQEQALNLAEIAHNKDLDVLMEVHNQKELENALNNPFIKIIGINNRNLNSFEVDINLALSLKNILSDRGFKGLVVAESGYTNLQELITLSKNSFQAVLIGEGLVKNKELLHAFKNNTKT